MEQDILKKVQTELGPWVKHNFPNRTPVLEPLLGVGEELGEILTAYLHRITLANKPLMSDDFLLYAQVYLSKIQHHYLKNKQGIRGDAHHHKQQMLIQLTLLLGALERFAGNQAMMIAINTPVSDSDVLMLRVGDTMEDGISDMDVYLCNLANDLGICRSTSLSEVWDKVKQRDFRANSNTGEVSNGDSAEG